MNFHQLDPKFVLDHKRRAKKFRKKINFLYKNNTWSHRTFRCWVLGLGDRTKFRCEDLFSNFGMGQTFLIPYRSVEIDEVISRWGRQCPESNVGLRGQCPVVCNIGSSLIDSGKIFTFYPFYPKLKKNIEVLGMRISWAVNPNQSSQRAYHFMWLGNQVT